MTMTHMPEDGTMTTWRLSGRFICACDRPAGRPVAMFGGQECATCGKLMAGRVGVELIERLVRAGVAS
jgi:hypothetical protein